MTKVDLTTRTLPCTLTPDEIRSRGVLLAKATQDIAAAGERHADVKTQLKAELVALQANQSRLANIVERGEEHRDVRVQIVYDYLAKTVTERREDTGDVLNVRQMTEAEGQMSIPGILD